MRSVEKSVNEIYGRDNNNWPSLGKGKDFPMLLIPVVEKRKRNDEKNEPFFYIKGFKKAEFKEKIEKSQENNDINEFLNEEMREILVDKQIFVNNSINFLDIFLIENSEEPEIGKTRKIASPTTCKQAFFTILKELNEKIRKAENDPDSQKRLKYNNIKKVYNDLQGIEYIKGKLREEGIDLGIDAQTLNKEELMNRVIDEDIRINIHDSMKKEINYELYPVTSSQIREFLDNKKNSPIDIDIGDAELNEKTIKEIKTLEEKKEEFIIEEKDYNNYIYIFNLINPNEISQSPSFYIKTNGELMYSYVFDDRILIIQNLPEDQVLSIVPKNCHETRFYNQMILKGITSSIDYYLFFEQKKVLFLLMKKEEKKIVKYSFINTNVSMSFTDQEIELKDLGIELGNEISKFEYIGNYMLAFYDEFKNYTMIKLKFDEDEKLSFDKVSDEEKWYYNFRIDNNFIDEDCIKIDNDKIFIENKSSIPNAIHFNNNYQDFNTKGNIDENTNQSLYYLVFHFPVLIWSNDNIITLDDYGNIINYKPTHEGYFLLSDSICSYFYSCFKNIYLFSIEQYLSEFDDDLKVKLIIVSDKNKEKVEEIDREFKSSLKLVSSEGILANLSYYNDQIVLIIYSNTSSFSIADNVLNSLFENNNNISKTKSNENPNIKEEDINGISHIQAIKYSKLFISAFLTFKYFSYYPEKMIQRTLNEYLGDFLE